MLKKLFDKNIEVKDISCGMNGNPGHPYQDTRINVYTCLTHICNTNCSFCNYHYNDSVAFDFEKFKSSFYTYGDSSTNFDTVLKSAENIRGIQELVDKYLAEKRFLTY